MSDINVTEGGNSINISDQDNNNINISTQENNIYIEGSGGSPTTFLSLTDTPSIYTGASGKYIRVNSVETDLEFDSLADDYLALDGSNANQDIDIGTYNLTANKLISDTEIDLDIYKFTKDSSSLILTLPYIPGNFGPDTYYGLKINSNTDYIRFSGDSGLRVTTNAIFNGSVTVSSLNTSTVKISDNGHAYFGDSNDAYISWIDGPFPSTEYLLNISSNTGKYRFYTGGGLDTNLYFYGTTNTGLLTWKQDEDNFIFADDVVLSANLTFGSNEFTSVATGAADNGVMVTKGYVDDAVEFENLWDRTGTVLSPHNVGDSVNLGTSYLTAVGGFGGTITVGGISGADISIFNSGLSAYFSGANGKSVYITDNNFCCSDSALYTTDGTTTVVLSDGTYAIVATGDVVVGSNTLYVDTANNRIGVGKVPTRSFDLTGDEAVAVVAQYENTNEDGFTALAVANDVNLKFYTYVFGSNYSNPTYPAFSANSASFTFGGTNSGDLNFIHTQDDRAINFYTGGLLATDLLISMENEVAKFYRQGTRQSLEVIGQNDHSYGILAGNGDYGGFTMDMYYNGSSWISTGTAASLIYKTPTGFTIYSDTGLTPGNSFTPSIISVFNGTTDTWEAMSNFYIENDLSVSGNEEIDGVLYLKGGSSSPIAYQVNDTNIFLTGISGSNGFQFYNANLVGSGSLDGHFVLASATAGVTLDHNFQTGDTELSGDLTVDGDITADNLSGTNTGDASGHTGLVPYTGATTNLSLGNNNLLIGTTGDYVMTANSGTNTVTIGNTSATIGAGVLEITGAMWINDKIKFTQTDGNEYIDSLADGYMDYGATTQHRFNNTVAITGGNVRSITTKTTDYTVLTSDYTILIDTTSNDVTLTLPASPTAGQIYNFKIIESSNTTTIARNGNNIDGSASDLTYSAVDSITLQYDSAYGWAII